VPVGWFIVPYKRDLLDTSPTRYCAMGDFTDVIRADGGAWSETEVLGNRAVVKVRASDMTLTTIALAPGFRRLLKSRLNDSLSDLTPAQRRALRDELEAMGYPLSEIRSRLGNDLGPFTLGDVLRFAATRRIKPRYDQSTDTILLDGPIQPCRSVDSVDVEVVG